MKKIKQRYAYALILLRQLVVTDFKLRYQGSVLGYLWSLLRPLALFVILYIVFAEFLRVGEKIEHYPIYLLVGIVIWNYFAEVTTGSVGAIVGKGDLLRKLNFPKYVIVLSGSFSALINLALNSLIIAVFMLILGVELRPVVLLLPLLILELFIFALGMGFLLSAVFVKFRDVNYIWEVIMQGAFYATPILYPLSYVTEHTSAVVAKLMMLNPMAQIIQDIRYVLITPSSETIATIYEHSLIRLVPILMVLLLVVFASWYFRSRSKYFAEEV